MARPKKQATCHPDRPNDALGLCHNCYRNARNASESGKKKRHDYYVRRRDYIRSKSKARWRALHPEVRRQHGIKANQRRARLAARGIKYKRKSVAKKLPATVMPPEVRETPKDFKDTDWWKVKDAEKPNAWRMNT